ncbi:MAG: hypothetical protein ACE5KM_02805 [Planctomycetaceae bacterium]
MTLNKKQKKQLDVSRKKLSELQQRLAAERKQTDDPQEIVSLEKQIADVQANIEKIRAEG